PPAARVQRARGTRLDHLSHELVAEHVAGLHRGDVAVVQVRSEPQMAVEVMRTIASLGLRISGSSTVSQRTSCLPCQMIAFMPASPPGSGPRCARRAGGGCAR